MFLHWFNFLYDCIVYLIFIVSRLGDQHSRRGALTGGFYDAQKSRLDLQRKVGQSKKKLEEQEQQLKALKAKIADILSNISHCIANKHDFVHEPLPLTGF